MNKLSHVSRLAFFASVLFLASCSHSVTNVWDYYIKNNIERHTEGATSSSKSKLLYRHQESVNKAQLEFIAFKQDSNKYLVIGSHKVAKAFVMYDSLYYFDVQNLYSSVRGDDFIRQLGDLSIFFAHIPAAKCDQFLNSWNDVKTKYNAVKPMNGETVYTDYTLAPGIFLSFPKTSGNQQPDDCVIWVGKRKHELNTNDLVKAMNDLKAFN